MKTYCSKLLDAPAGSDDTRPSFTPHPIRRKARVGLFFARLPGEGGRSAR